MGKVIAEITMSLDGLIAGPGISSKEPMRTGGERLHDWIFNKATGTDKIMINEMIKSTGAVITGNYTYTMAIDDGWAGASPFDAPAFVTCHTAPVKKVEGFAYVTGGVGEALKLAGKPSAKKMSG